MYVHHKHDLNSAQPARLSTSRLESHLRLRSLPKGGIAKKYFIVAGF